MSIFVVFGFWRFCSWLKSPTKHWCLAQWSLFIELVIWYCSSIFTKICVQLRKFCAIEFFIEKIIDWIKKSRWTVVSLSVGTHLFVRQLLSEIGSCFRNILLVGTAWRQFLRKFWFLLVLNINNTKKTSLNVSKLSFISIRVIAYLYIQHIILLFFTILNCKWRPFSLASATFGRVNVG